MHEVSVVADREAAPDPLEQLLLETRLGAHWASMVNTAAARGVEPRLLPVAPKLACAGIKPEATEGELPIRHSAPHPFPENPELGQNLPDRS